MIATDQLYQPDKFKVHLGEGQVGFCTVWNEPEAVLHRAPELRKRAAIVSTLYGRQGVSIIIRNLALNPHVRRLYMWGHGNLSQTKFGVTGKDAIMKLWANGVADDHTIIGTNAKLEDEIDLAVVKQIIAGVELVDVSAEPLETVVSNIGETVLEAYMAPVRFPDAKPKAVEKFPSEEVGFVVHGNGIINTWQKALHRIMTYGTVKGTQYGMPQKELIHITWVVNGEDPDAPDLSHDWPQALREVTGASADALVQYFPVILSPDAQPGTSYTYGNRLQKYPNGDSHIDQIADVIVKQFKSSPDSRRGVATTLHPPTDWDSKEPPCLTQVQCLQSNGKFHMLCTFRSHDMFKAAIANAFALRKLQKNMSAELGFEMGALSMTSESAHVYEADWDNAKKLIACAFIERDPGLVFKAEDGDPRGNCVIAVSSGEISLTLLGPDGAELTQIKGPSAKHIQRKLGQLELISQVGHALDVGMELQKAQIAKEKGIPYVQDRPLAL